MGSINYEIVRSSTAPPDRVFALLSDAPGWPTWFKLIRKVSWEPGAEPPVRLVTLGPGLTIREVVLEETAPTHHAYSIQSVFPVKNHRADVRLTARPDGGTDIRWTSTCDPKLPGTGGALKVGLSKAVGDLCKALVKASEA
jgi:hypothetical protein